MCLPKSSDICQFQSYKRRQSTPPGFWTRKAGPTQVVLLLVVVVISSLKLPQSILNTQRSATKLCVHIRADIAHRSTVSDFPGIFQLMSDLLIKCSRYCAVYCRRSACSAASIAAACCSTMRGAAHAAARCAVEHSNEYLCTGGAYRRHVVE